MCYVDVCDVGSDGGLPPLQEPINRVRYEGCVCVEIERVRRGRGEVKIACVMRVCVT